MFVYVIFYALIAILQLVNKQQNRTKECCFKQYIAKFERNVRIWEHRHISNILQKFDLETDIGECQYQKRACTKILEKNFYFFMDQAV